MRLAEVDFSDHGRIVVARIDGEIDLSNTEMLGSALAEATSNHRHALIVDMGGVEYLDSAGIQLIYQLRERLRTRGQQLGVVIPAGSPARVSLRLAGIERDAILFDTVDEALGRLSPDA